MYVVCSVRSSYFCYFIFSKSILYTITLYHIKVSNREHRTAPVSCKFSRRSAQTRAYSFSQDQEVMRANVSPTSGHSLWVLDKESGNYIISDYVTMNIWLIFSRFTWETELEAYWYMLHSDLEMIWELTW